MPKIIALITLLFCITTLHAGDPDKLGRTYLQSYNGAYHYEGPETWFHSPVMELKTETQVCNSPQALMTVIQDFMKFVKAKKDGKDYKTAAIVQQMNEKGQCFIMANKKGEQPWRAIQLNELGNGQILELVDTLYGRRFYSLSRNWSAVKK